MPSKAICMFRDGYHCRLVLKLPYYRTEPHKIDAARPGIRCVGDNSGPSTPVPVQRRGHETAGMPIRHPGRQSRRRSA